MANEYEDILRSQTPAPGNEYDELVKEQATDATTDLRLSMTAAAAADPDKHAKAIRYAQQYGLPVPTVERNLDTIERRDVVSRNDYERILRETPALGTWLRDPSNATIAKDDVEHLSMLEKTLDAAKRGYLTLKQTPWATGLVANQRLAQGAEANFAAIETRLANGEAPASIPDSEDTYGVRWMSQQERDEFKAKLRASFSSGTGEQATRLAQYETEKRKLPTDPVIAAALQSHTFGEFWQHFSKKPAEFILTVGAESLPASAPGLVAAVPAAMVAGPGGAAVTIGANSFVTDYASSVMEALQDEGVDIKNPDSVREAVKDKELMGRVGQRAFAHATVVGSVDAMSGGLAGKTLVPKRMVMHPVAREGANIAVQAPAQGLAGAIGEAGGEIAAGQDLEAGNIAAEFFGEFFGTPAEVAAASSGHIVEKVQEARSAKQNERLFQALGEGVQNSKTFERLPEKLQELVAAATKDGPIENVYIPIEAWTTYWQSQNADPSALAADLTGDPRAYQQAIATGEDLVIPTARYATRIAPSEHNKYFSTELRLSPEAMSAREADSFLKDLKTQADEAAIEDSAAAVREDVFGQLLGLGFERSTAEAYSNLYEQTFRTLGQRAGVDPLELYQKYGLKVERPMPAVLREIGKTDAIDAMIDRLRKGDLPTPREMYGPSLLEFLKENGGLKDEGGELAARDLRKARRGLMQENGMLLDHAAERAVEAGYLAERDPQLLLDAIDMELRGRPLYAPGAGNSDLQNVNATLDQLDEYLRQLGVDVQTTDNAKIKELLRAESQTANPATESPAGAAGATGGPPVVYYQGEKDDNGNGYQQDLFGNPLPDQAGKKRRAAGAGNVQSAVAIRALQSRDDAPGVYAVETALISERTRTLPLDVVDTPAQAAQVLAYLSNYAVEHLDALITDAQGKVLAIVGAFKGTINAAPVYPYTVMGEAIRVDGAANIWFAHNHPSGDSTLSTADERLWQKLIEVFSPTQIKPRAMFAIAGTGNVRQYSALDDNGLGISGSATRAPDVVAVPVVERVYTKDSRLWSKIEDPATSKLVTPSIAGKNPGVMLLDNRHAPVAFVPIAPAEARSLRSQARVDQLYRAISKANASAAIIANPNNAYTISDANNLAGALQLIDLRVLDIIDYNDAGEVTSRSEEGRDIGDGRTTLTQTAGNLNRGAIHISGERQFNIELLEKADLSTFLHETGHFYLEILGDLAERPDAPENLKQDYQTILKWLGVEQRADVGREQHEKFARGFEAYLMEGRAPSAALRSAFAKFRAWLVAVYRTIVRLNVKLNDDVRAVMDRLLATDEAIAAAEGEGQVEALFKDAEAAGMTDVEFAAYQKTVAAASASAREHLQERLLREQRREQEKWWKGAREKIRNEIIAEINEHQVYSAAAFLSRGTRADGTPLPDGVLPFKLDRKAIADAYGSDFLKRLPRPIVYTREGGVHPDQAAEALGFQSGEQLLMDLVNMRPQKQLIEAETDARLRERYGDLLLDGAALAAAAQQAIEGPERAKVIEAEIKALRKKAREVRPFINAERKNQAAKQREGVSTLRGSTLPLGAIKAMAEGIIAQKRVRDLNPNQCLVALRRAAKQAIEAAAKDDYDVAAAAKQRELLNLELYRAAVAAREEVDAIATHMGRFSRTSVRERLGKAGADYLEQIDAILDRFDFKRLSNKASERRQTLAEWIRTKEQNGESLGEELGISEQLKNEAFRTNYRELSVEELRGVNDAVRQIEHFARLKNKLLAAQGAREREEARAELLSALEANLKDRGPPPLSKAGLTKAQAIGKRVSALDASLLKMEQLVDWMDGGDINGPWHRYFWDGAAAAQNAELDYSKKITALVTKAVMNIPADIRKRMLERVQIDGVDRVVTRKDLIGIALNVGNEGNHAKLLKGMGWSEGQLEQMLARLTKEEFDFVQSIWDTLETLWPDIAKLQKELTGLEPEKVEARAVKTPYGELRGGYYPIMYDPLASEQGALQLGARVGDLTEGGYTRATTPKGHTKARTEGFARPFNLDIDDLPSHIAGVVKDLTHRKWLIDANWIAHDRDVRAALRQHLGDEYVQLFPDWVRSVANDRNFASMRTLNVWRRGIEHLRYNVMIAAMGFKAATMASQISGIGPAIEVVGGEEGDGRKYFTRAFAQVMRRPRTVYDMATGLSGELRHRLDNRDRDLRDKLRLLEGREDWLAKFQEFALRGIAWADMMVSLPTWLAGYQKAIEQGSDQDTAVRAGDRAVRLSQGSGGAKDLASVMARNDTLMRILTMFYTPFNALYNRLRAVGHDVEGIRDVPQAALRLWWIWLVPAVMGELLSGHGPDEDKDEGWFKWWLKTTLLYPMLSVPFVRDVASGVLGNFGYQLSPVAQVGESVARTINTAGKVATGDKEIEDLAKSALKTTGYLVGVPSSQLQITGGYLYGVATGEENPEDLADFAYHVLYRKRQ